MAKGLIHAVVLDGKGGATPLSWEQAQNWNGAGGVLWMHLDYSDETIRQWLRESSGLDAVVAEALCAEETRPRATAIDDGLLIALRGVNLNPGANPEDMVAIRAWIESNRIISSRRRYLLSVRDMLETLEQKKGPVSAGDFLVELNNRLTYRMGDVIEATENRMSELEEAVLNEHAEEHRTQLSTLRRQSIALRRYLSPQREALIRLQTEKISWLNGHDHLRLREVSDRLIRYIEDLDAVRDRAAVTQEELVSRMSDQLNKRMYILSIVAAIFLPLGFFTGLLGINVGGIPGEGDSWAFTIFLFILGGIAAVQLWIFRKKRWL